MMGRPSFNLKTLHPFFKRMLPNLLVFLLGFVAALVVLAAISWVNELHAPPMESFIEQRTPEPRTAATHAISKEEAADISKYVESIDAAHLREIPHTVSTGASSDDATLTGLYQGDHLVEIQRTHLTPTGRRSLGIYYRNGAIVYVAVAERWDPQGSAPPFPRGTRMSWTSHYFVDGHIVTYWEVPGGVLPIGSSTDSAAIAKEIEQQVLADDAIAHELFKDGW